MFGLLKAIRMVRKGKVIHIRIFTQHEVVYVPGEANPLHMYVGDRVETVHYRPGVTYCSWLSALWYVLLSDSPPCYMIARYVAERERSLFFSGFMNPFIIAAGESLETMLYPSPDGAGVINARPVIFTHDDADVLKMASPPKDEGDDFRGDEG